MQISIRELTVKAVVSDNMIGGNIGNAHGEVAVIWNTV